MVFESVVPIAKDAYQLLEVTALGKYWGLRQTIETLTWRGNVDYANYETIC